MLSKAWLWFHLRMKPNEWCRSWWRERLPWWIQVLLERAQNTDTAYWHGRRGSRLIIDRQGFQAWSFVEGACWWCRAKDGLFGAECNAAICRLVERYFSERDGGEAGSTCSIQRVVCTWHQKWWGDSPSPGRLKNFTGTKGSRSKIIRRVQYTECRFWEFGFGGNSTSAAGYESSRRRKINTEKKKKRRKTGDNSTYWGLIAGIQTENSPTLKQDA